MKKELFSFGIILGCIAFAHGAPTSPLTSLRAINDLSNGQASKGIPVAFQATVTYFRQYENTLFLYDDGVSLYVKAQTDLKLLPGDRILVRGITQDSFRPDVVSQDITLLRHGRLPKPTLVSFDQAIRGEIDCQLVTMHGIVRAADSTRSLNAAVVHSTVQVLTKGGYVEVTVDSHDLRRLEELLDAEVDVTGVVSGRFDGKMQQTGVLMHVSSFDDVHVLKRAAASPWEIPITPMDEILRSSHMDELSSRVRVEGTITYYQPGHALVLQNGPRSLWVVSEAHDPMRLGDLAEATGIPDVRDGFLTLNHAEVRDRQTPAPAAPLSATWRTLASSKHIFDLASIEGTVLMEAREATQDEYVLVADGHIFSAIYQHANAARQLSLEPMKQVALGSRVRVTGICMNEDVNPFNGPVPFHILLREPADLIVLANPSLLNVKNLILVVGLLLAIIIFVGVRGWLIERRVRRQMAALAALERQRSHILEDINRARPLAEIIEQITKLVSLKLKDAPCWCHIAGGATLGSYPGALTALRVVEEAIPSRSGPPLGTLFVGLSLESMPCGIEAETLQMGAGLATLAIETRRMNSELRHRSEFDLLTDIHNRFSIERYIELQIDEMRGNAGVFGLIYIDLDDFKQVNDQFGHQIGDQFLQEVASRMKRQLRPKDMLARLGGDEFAVLVPVVKSREDVQEIAERLERCLDKTMLLGGCVLQAAASVGIALYPEDGGTRDELLSFADTAMYAAKKNKVHTQPAGVVH